MSKDFLDIQATIECGFTLKCVRDMIRTQSQNNKGTYKIKKKKIKLKSRVIKGIKKPITVRDKIYKQMIKKKDQLKKIKKHKFFKNIEMK